ncbi:Kinesin-like protein [Drosera capensis]
MVIHDKPQRRKPNSTLLSSQFSQKKNNSQAASTKQNLLKAKQNQHPPTPNPPTLRCRRHCCNPLFQVREERMASAKQGARTTTTRKNGSSALSASSVTTTTATSLSKQVAECSVEGASSPVSKVTRMRMRGGYAESSVVVEEEVVEEERSKENVMVTVRFRPLSPREIRQGEEIAWYADGETIVRNEYNPSIAYAYGTQLLLFGCINLSIILMAKQIKPTISLLRILARSVLPLATFTHHTSQRSQETTLAAFRFRCFQIISRTAREGTGQEEMISALNFLHRVFGPTTTTHHVYDVVAQQVVSGAMEGINGTIFAYGVTSSGKTHTMHGDQRSPGIIPLAVKDAFSIIQETPTREFLLRVSYLEIYNEVVNDLLNPAGQNLRIREDHQGIFIEGIKEEVVLSPAHALSLIAAGEEHRHVGSTNFNLLSSRSHTIFTLTIESSSCGEDNEGEAVNLSQLHLIDLAGSESSKAETVGVRRKEGAYINKSLLTLGTVISKLTEGRSTHIPFRNSKLTRLLQSSLSGHGRVSLICTVTPSSSNAEETHNTLKFAHRAKHIEIQAAQNKIMDEKSLIKKYQNDIRALKEELEQLRSGIVTAPQLKDAGEEDILRLRQKKSRQVLRVHNFMRTNDGQGSIVQSRTSGPHPMSVLASLFIFVLVMCYFRESHQLEDGQVKLQSRLEQEEEAKEALLARIQRLTKLILVSSKTTQQSSRFPHRPGPRRRHSFGEEELAYLPYKRRDLMMDDENADMYISPEGNGETDDILKDEKKSRKNGLLSWLKIRKKDGSLGTVASTSDKSSGVRSISSPSTPQGDFQFPNESRNSPSVVVEATASRERLDDCRHDREAPEDSFSGQGTETPQTSVKSMDQIDLLREQQKILSGEVALHSSFLKRLSEEAAKNPKKENIQVEMRKLSKEMRRKSEQIASIEKNIFDSIVVSHRKMDKLEISQTIADLVGQLNEKSFELEVKCADNRVIQEQLNQKISECEGLQAEVTTLKQQLSEALESRNTSVVPNHTDNTRPVEYHDTGGQLLMQTQAAMIEELSQKVTELTETNEQLELRNKKLAEDSSYAKGLASAAAVELKALSEEVAKLMNQKETLTSELAALKNSTNHSTNPRKPTITSNGRRESQSRVKRQDQGSAAADAKKELAVSREREAAYEAALSEKEQREVELQGKVEKSKQREAYLENELANMWVLVAKLKTSHGADDEISEALKKRG